MRQFLWKAHAAALLASLSLWSGGLHAAQPTAVSVMELLELEGIGKDSEAMANLKSFDDFIRLGDNPKMKNTPAFQSGRQQLDAMYKAMAQLPPEARAEFQAVVVEMFNFFGRMGASKEMRVDLFRAYQQTYTQEEVDAWIAFLKTPAGQSAVFKKAGLQLVMQEIFIANVEKHQAEFRGFFEKLEALDKKYKPRNAPSNKKP